MYVLILGFYESSYRYIDYGGGGQKLRTFQMTPLSPNCSRKLKTGSVVFARPFVARHRSVSTCLRCSWR